MTARKNTQRTATEILDERFFRGKPEMEALLAEEEANAEVAGLIHQARSAAGLTQQQLADRIGTTKSAISRLEDADYRGHSLAMLRRVAAALGCRVRMEFEPAKARASRPRSRVADRRQANAIVVSESEVKYGGKRRHPRRNG